MANLCVSVSNDIEQKIREGRFKINEKLPSERAMSELYSVSRSVIREALKALEEKKLVEVCVGKGVFVTRPSVENLSDTLITAIDTDTVNLTEVAEAREMLEFAIADKAIKNAVEQDIEELKQIYEEMDKNLNRGAVFAELDTKFHLRIAECSANNILILFTKALNTIIDRKMIVDTYNGYSVRERAQIEHKAMIMALEYQEKEDLYDAISRHMHCIRQQIEEIKQ